MIEYVAVTNFKGERLELPLANPWESCLAVKSITGLGPVDATVNMTNISSSDGAIFNSSRIKTRTVEMTLGLLSDAANGVTIEDSRLKTYRFFQNKRPLTLEVKTDRRYVAAVGYTEKNEPNIFSSDEECDITIVFPDPFFYSLMNTSEGSFDFSAKQGGFEFAFANESLKQKLLEFAHLSFLEEINLPYDGDVETGISIRMNATGNVFRPRVVKNTEGVQMAIDTSTFTKYGDSKIGHMVSGDEVIINTRRGQKSVTLHRDGKSYNIINSVDKDADWLTVTPGDNLFAYDTTSGSSNLRVTVEYVTTFLGV